MKKNVIISIIAILFVIGLVSKCKDDRNYTKPIDNCFSAVKECDGEKFYNTLYPSNIEEKSIDAYLKDLKKESGLKIKNSDKKEFIKTFVEPSKKEIMNTLSDALSKIKSNSEEYYGKDYKVKYKVKSKKKMSKDEIEDLCSYYKKEYPMLCYAFDSKDVDNAITVSIDYTCKGSKNERNKEVDINLYYISGDGWLMDERSLDSLFVK